MRWLFCFWMALAPLLVANGCGPSRPDPRANPDFDEEAYSDPNQAMQRMQAPGTEN